MEERNEILEQKPASSFDLKRTSRGVNIRVKIYSCDAVEEIDRAQKECEKRFNELDKKYNSEE